VALTGDATTPASRLQAAFDPQARCLKVVVIGGPADVARLLDMPELQAKGRS
jgi:hypothetical protein